MVEFSEGERSGCFFWSSDCTMAWEGGQALCRSMHMCGGISGDRRAAPHAQSEELFSNNAEASAAGCLSPRVGRFARPNL
jgi:hypothetical protein